MSDSGYNGWTNYPTWAVHLWLTNDEHSYSNCEWYAREAQKYDPPRVALADMLKSSVRDAVETGEASLGADLLGYALDSVEWFQIADAFLADTQNEEERSKVLREDGYAAGVAAGSWVVDGNTPDHACHEIVRMFDEGDPLIYDAMPSPLSGEWADDHTSRDILDRCGIYADSIEPEEETELLDEWSDGFRDGWEAEVRRSAQSQLGENAS